MASAVPIAFVPALSSVHSMPSVKVMPSARLADAGWPSSHRIRPASSATTSTCSASCGQRAEAVAQDGQQLAERRGAADVGELGGVQRAARVQPLGVAGRRAVDARPRLGDDRPRGQPGARRRSAPPPTCGAAHAREARTSVLGLDREEGVAHGPHRRSESSPRARGRRLPAWPSGVSVGVVANPASGRDIRRLVAGASVFGNADKAGMVFRAARRARRGGGRAGADDARLRRPLRPRCTASCTRTRGARRPRRAPFPELEQLDMALDGSARDSAGRGRARCARAGVRAIVVLGGDGTHRVVAKACGDVPLCALSTGTNNAFPEMRETTVAGLATGLVAAAGCRRGALRREGALVVERDGAAPDLALVDVAVTASASSARGRSGAARGVSELFVTFAHPSAVGLSAVAGRARAAAARRGRGRARAARADPRAAATRRRRRSRPGLVAAGRRREPPRARARAKPSRSPPARGHARARRRARDRAPRRRARDRPARRPGR